MSEQERRGGKREGAGRKKGPLHERWSVRIDPELKAELSSIPAEELRKGLEELARRHREKGEN